MQFRRYESDFFLNVPNALSASSFPVEQSEVVCVCLRIVSRYQTEKRRFARAVMSGEEPSLMVAHFPVDAAEQCLSLHSHMHIVHFHDEFVFWAVYWERQVYVVERRYFLFFWF